MEPERLVASVSSPWESLRMGMDAWSSGNGRGAARLGGARGLIYYVRESRRGAKNFRPCVELRAKPAGGVGQRVGSGMRGRFPVGVLGAVKWAGWGGWEEACAEGFL